MKLLQNKIAENGMTLPVTICFALAVWVVGGLIEGHWWAQLLCFIASTALIGELSNNNALIRVRSRMVSCAFLALSSTICFLFDSLLGGIVQLCFIASCLLIFRSYQDKQAVGWTFYAFLCIGLASVAYVQILYFLPFLWLLMAFNLLSLSWRTWIASLLGLMLPYWFLCPYCIYTESFTLLANHFAALTDVELLMGYEGLTVSQMLVYVLIVVLSTIGSLHFWRYSYEDKIRIRQLYSYFMTLNALSLTMLALSPQHYDILIRIAIVNTSPIIAHFLTLTHSRITNIAFFVITGIVVLITAFNLWMPSLTF